MKCENEWTLREQVMNSKDAMPSTYQEGTALVLLKALSVRCRSTAVAPRAFMNQLYYSAPRVPKASASCFIRSQAATTTAVSASSDAGSRVAAALW